MKFFKILLMLILASFGSFAQFEDNVTLIANWQAEDAPEIRPYSNKYHDVWGVEIKNREYAVMSTQRGTHIIDITDVERGDSLKSLHFIPAAYQGNRAIHRDYHDYNGYLYVVCDEGESTLQVIDIRNLPDTVNVVYDSDELFSTTHNIFIDTARAILYTAGANPGNVKVISLENPEKPTLLYDYNTPYTHDLFVRDNIGYLNQADFGFQIVEFKFNDEDVVKKGILNRYEDQGYNHSGWLSEDGNYYALCDENYGLRVKLLDVSDPLDIKVVALFGSDVSENSIAHNVIIKDHYAFVSYYYDGLQVFDFSNPEEVKKVAQFDTYLIPNNMSFKGAWGVYPNFKSEKILISDMQTGLYVLDVALAPIADFTFQIDSTELNLIHFTDASRWNPKTFTWTFEGEEIAYEQNIIYDVNNFEGNQDGVYEVCLEARNAQGSDKICQTVNHKIVNVIENHLNQNIEIQTINQQLIVEFALSYPTSITYSISDVSGKILLSENKTEPNGLIQQTFDLSRFSANNLLIFSLQSGNEIWSAKVSHID